VTKEAIAKAVTQAGNREIERLKGDLASQLEEKKQAFTKEMEQFKAQLTLEAEVRRQVGAKKVEALLKMVSVTRVAVETIYGISTDDSQARERALKDYGVALREGLVFFGPKLIAEIEALLRELSNGHVTRGRGDRGAPDFLDVAHKGEVARNSLYDTIRRELRLLGAEELEPKS
jgi:hypothetical protein